MYHSYLKDLQLIKSSQIIKHRFWKAMWSQTTAKMLCNTTNCYIFCWENRFGFEPSFPFVINLDVQQTTAGIS